MQDESFIPNGNIAPARHRRRAITRTQVMVTAAVVVAALGLGGVAVAAAGHGDAAVPAAAIDAQARADAAGRADRSTRESDSPSPASPTPSPVTASATPKVTTKPEVTTKPKPSVKPKPKKTAKPKPAWVIPMKGATITSCYGPRGGVLHAGIDFAMPAGTPVHAAFGGTVEKAGDVGDGYGISVVVNHGNGYLTHYAHLSTATVNVGDKVSAGQTIGLEGSTGDSTGPHLHFEVHQGQMWNQIDPAPFLRARGIDVGC